MPRLSVQGKANALEKSLQECLDEQYRHLFDDTATAEKENAFWENFHALLHAENERVQAITLDWGLSLMKKRLSAPSLFQDKLFSHLRVFEQPSLAPKLIHWLAQPDNHRQEDVFAWLSHLNYATPDERAPIIQWFVQRYLSDKDNEASLMKALKHLDTPAGEVTNWILNVFPQKLPENNHRFIKLLGYLGRYRAVKPLIAFINEYPEYLRSVMKAFLHHDFLEVDQFYLDCLHLTKPNEPLSLIEAIKQIRRRRLRKAIPTFDKLFPIESGNGLINRTINGEIALCMASFGVYSWAREKLLSEMVLSGINTKYLKAIDILNLEEAIPLLKALLLLPETPELSVIQEKAFEVCTRLLSQQREALKSIQASLE